MRVGEGADKKGPVLVSVEIMGKRCQVPEGLTMHKAMWYAGYEITRGAGCLGGFCGACTVMYRTRMDHELKVGLACQILVEEGMSFALIPYYPAVKPAYLLEDLSNPKEEIFQYYPEVSQCRNCNACTDVCPQGIDVRTGVWKVVFGDFKDVSDMFLSCVMCGLCVPVCIADIAPNQVALFASRTYASLLLEKPPNLLKKEEEIKGGKYDREWEHILQMDPDELKTFCLTGARSLT